jgi:hypothetical protein
VRPRLNILACAHKDSLLALFAICLASMVTMVPRLDAQTLRGTANPSISISTAVPGSEPTPVSNTGSQIRYSGTSVISKITVRTVCPNQKFDLSVIATGTFTGHGSPVSVTLVNGMLAADFIISIPANSAQNTPTLKYTCAPQFSDGTGTDNHTVYYTQVAQ